MEVVFHTIFPRKLFVIACLLLVLLPPAVAYAGTQFDYAQGYNGAGGIFETSGAGPRDYNQVWHHAGSSWTVAYAWNGLHGVVTNTSNPTKWPNPIGYAYARCQNINDNSYVLWTCQTTK